MVLQTCFYRWNRSHPKERLKRATLIRGTGPGEASRSSLINQSSPLRKGKPLFIKHSTPKSSHELTYGESLIFRVHTSHVVPQAGEGPTCSTDSANDEHKSTKFDTLLYIPVPTSQIPDPTSDLEPDRDPNSNLNQSKSTFQ